MPNLFVFGAMPRSARITSSPSKIERGVPINKAIRAAEFKQSKSRISFVLSHPSGPKDKKNVNHLNSLPIGSPILVWSTVLKYWISTQLINLDGETVAVELTKGRNIFLSTGVRP